MSQPISAAVVLAPPFEWWELTIRALAFTSDGSVLVIALGQELQLFDAKDGKLLGHHQDPKPIISMTMSADSTLLVTVDSVGDFIFGVPQPGKLFASDTNKLTCLLNTNFSFACLWPLFAPGPYRTLLIAYCNYMKEASPLRFHSTTLFCTHMG